MPIDCHFYRCVHIREKSDLPNDTICKPIAPQLGPELYLFFKDNACKAGFLLIAIIYIYIKLTYN